MTILYWVNGSIPSWQVLLALHEKALPFEGRRLRVMGTQRETRTPEFLALNPKGQAPLWHDPARGIVLAESFAILHYLEATSAQYPPLLPTAPAELARCLERLYRVEILRAAYRPLEQLFHATSPVSPAVRAAPAAVAVALQDWEAHLSEAPFVAGDSLTLADCVFYPVLAYQIRRGLPLTAARWPHLCAYGERMAARPAAQAAHPQGWTRPRGRRDLFAEAGAP